MSARLQLKQFQIALLELYAANKDFDGVHVPSHIRWSLGGMGPTPYIESQRKHQKWERKQLYRRIAYLKRQHYLERVKEGEELLYKLTTKAKYEILRLNFILHMKAQRKQKWDGKFYLVVFDVPEEKKRYRDVFRRLLHAGNFRMLQLSVWMTRYNPRPVIDELLKYLKLEKYFEIMVIPCANCSPRLQKKIR